MSHSAVVRSAPERDVCGCGEHGVCNSRAGECRCQSGYVNDPTVSTEGGRCKGMYLLFRLFINNAHHMQTFILICCLVGVESCVDKCLFWNAK